MQTLDQAKAAIEGGGVGAAVQMLSTARANNDTATAWIIVRAAQLINNRSVRDAIDEYALSLFELSEIYAGKQCARHTEINVDGAVQLISAIITLAIKDAGKDDGALEWLIDGAADEFLKACDLDVCISRKLATPGQRMRR